MSGVRRGRSVNLEPLYTEGVLFVTQAEWEELRRVMHGAAAAASDELRRVVAAVSLREYLAPLLPVEHIDDFIRRQTTGDAVEVVVDERRAVA